MSDEIDVMFEHLLVDKDEIPEHLIAQYIDFCMRRTVIYLKQARRESRMSMEAPADVARHDEIRRKVLAFLVEDGLNNILPPHRIAEFPNPGDLKDAMWIHARECKRVATSLKNPNFRYAADRIFGMDSKTEGQIYQINQAYLTARAAVYDDVYPPRPEILNDIEKGSHDVPPGEPDVAQHEQANTNTLLTDGVTLHDGALTHEILDDQFAKARASNEALDRSPKSNPFSHDLAGVCERSIKRDLASGKIDEKTADSRRMSLKLFSFLTSVQLVTEVEQHHLAIFIKAMKTLPKNFNRSIHDRRKTLASVLAEARLLPDDKLGRDPGTMNRHLETVGALISYARVQERIPVDPDIDTSQLRVIETKRARYKRESFQRDEVVTLFRHHIWHGCKNETRRQEHGNLVLKDGLFWVPLIVHYTGARLEEIAGIPASAVMEHGKDWGFDIRPHEERRLKNLQSERLLPVHEHLIELGLIEHRDRIIAGNEEFLFPELRPKSSKLPFHKAMKYNWDKARFMQLGAAAEGLTMHSMRHYVNITLKGNKAVEKSVRLDILGHAAVDLNEEVYTAGASFGEKLEAINSIPRAF